MGLALDEPENDDKVEIINQIQVAIDPDIEAFTAGLTLEFNQETNELVLSGNESSCC